MNKQIQELAEQARKYARDYISECKIYGYYMEHNEYELRFEEKFVELIVKEVVSKMEVEGSDFHYNEPNNYGAITVKFFVEGNANQMAGEETKAQYHDGIRGTGRYKLNDKFVKDIMKQHFGIEE